MISPNKMLALKAPYILLTILGIQIVYMFHSTPLQQQCICVEQAKTNTKFSKIIRFERTEPKNLTTTQQPSLENLEICQRPAEILNALEILDSRNESREAIFFIESSNKGTITARQVCAVESTARYNPEADVYVLLLDPPEDPDLAIDEQVLTLLRYHKNVRLLRVESANYYNGTPLQEWSLANRINTSYNRVEDASDMLRIVTLLKYGGKYLDLDFVIQQSLDSMPPNFLSFELGSDVCNGVLGFQKGHPMLQMMVQEQADTYDGTIWGYNGPTMISRVMGRFCGISQAEIFETGKKCVDVVVFKQDKFFPISYPGWERYFDEAAGPEVMDLAKGYLGVHMYNYLSHGSKVPLGSNQAYSLLAQKHCPRAYWSCSENF
ncbi:lactosylceramide 4-alpha-galactosyltransferase-like [Cloeon dipterum]|uniref:lactosylceramide 4-alpha-galactosyltransferase-like n=1 Tax=Cloeon dipterum TaxID=197152 RepID=UPI0032201CC3